MKNRVIRSSVVIRRLSYVSLFKIFLLGGFGLTVPFCALGLLIAAVSPGNVRLEEGQTMLQFILILLGVTILWPPFFALFLGTAAWVAMSAKGLFGSTSIEVLRDDRGFSSEVPIQSPGTTADPAPDRGEP